MLAAPPLLYPSACHNGDRGVFVWGALTITVSLVGSGGLGTRLGLIFGGLLDVLALEGGTATARVLSGASWQSRISSLQTDYSASVASPKTVDGIFSTVSAWQSAQNGFCTQLQTLARQTVIDMVDADSPLPSRDLTSALKVLISQMVGASTSFNASVPSAGAQTSVGSPSGNPIIVVSVKSGSGVKLQFCIPETLRYTVATDSQSGGATAGLESLSVVGQAQAANNFLYNWPLGSGLNASLTAVSGATNNSSGNLLYNSDFTSFSTANYPDQFVIATGTAGTDIKNGTASNAYTTNGGSLQFVGDGSTLSGVTQTFGTSTSSTAGAGGTPATLLPNSIYHVNGWVKVDTAPAAGVLQVALIDGSAATISDDASGSNAFTRDLTTLTNATWTNINGTFITPKVLPSTIKLRLKLSTAITAASNLYMGRFAMAKAAQLGAGGAFCTVFSGNTKMIAGDAWTLALAQVWGTFMREFERCFGMRTLGLEIPVTTSSPTVADSLVV